MLVPVPGIFPLYLIFLSTNNSKLLLQISGQCHLLQEAPQVLPIGSNALLFAPVAPVHPIILSLHFPPSLDSEALGRRDCLLYLFLVLAASLVPET